MRVLSQLIIHVIRPSLSRAWIGYILQQIFNELAWFSATFNAWGDYPSKSSLLLLRMIQDFICDNVGLSLFQSLLQVDMQVFFRSWITFYAALARV